MDIHHHIQLGWKRLASQIRIQKIPTCFGAIKNYSKFAVFVGASLSLGVLAFTETRKNTMVEWLNSNQVHTHQVIRWMKSYGMIESTESRLIREVTKTIPFNHNRAEAFSTKSTPVWVIIEKSGLQHVLVPEGDPISYPSQLEWQRIDLTWDQMDHLFEQLNQQIQIHNKTRKLKTKAHTSDPYELRY